MQCIICKSKNRDGISFCEFCGAKLQNEPLNKQQICLACGKENRPGIRFCEYCGKSLAAEISPVQATLNEQICPTCKKPNRMGIQFCEYCGENLRSKPRSAITITPKKKFNKFNFFIPGGAALIVILIVIISGALTNRNSYTLPPQIPDESALSSLPTEQPAIDQSDGVAFPDFGDLHNLTEEQAQTIGNAFIETHYPDLELIDNPDVEYDEVNEEMIIGVIYGIQSVTDSGVMIDHVIIVNINADDGTIAVIESN